MLKRFFASAFLIVLSFTLSGVCGEYYVDVTREVDDISNDGTSENPWATITEALIKVRPTEDDPAVAGAETLGC